MDAIKNSMVKTSSLKKMKTMDNIMDIVFFAPQFILYTLFTLLPFAIALPMVFTDYLNFLAPEVHFIGLQNFATIFRYPIIDQFLPALGRTATFTFFNYLTLFILALPIALLMFEFKSRFKSFFFTAIFLPLMLSGVGLGMILSMLFARDTGSMNLLLMKLGIIKHALDINNSATTLIILPLLAGWRFAGYNMAIFLSGLLSVPSETVEASIVDGVNYWQRLIYIYLPQIVPSITIATILCLLGSFGVFDECVGLGALAGNQNAYFLSVLIYTMGFSGGLGGGALSQSGTLAEGVTISMVVFLPLVILAFILNKIQKKLQY